MSYDRSKNWGGREIWAQWSRRLHSYQWSGETSPQLRLLIKILQETAITSTRNLTWTLQDNQLTLVFANSKAKSPKERPEMPVETSKRPCKNSRTLAGDMSQSHTQRTRLHKSTNHSKVTSQNSFVKSISQVNLSSSINRTCTIKTKAILETIVRLWVPSRRSPRLAPSLSQVKCEAAVF